MGDEMTMVERVAREICKNAGHIDDRHWQHYKKAARAAIAAMREPTKAMLAATEDVVTGYDDFAVSDGTLYLSYPGFYDHAIAAHHAMIDAALKETA